MKTIYENLAELRVLISDFNKKSNSKCLMLGCVSNAIDSHTLSKSRVLGMLEGIKGTSSEIGIYQIDNKAEIDYREKTLSTYHKSKRELVFVGKGIASVFSGFCSKHDSEVFWLLDNVQYNNSSEINFLHAYRAFSYFLHKEKEFIAKIDSILPDLNVNVDLADTMEDFKRKLELCPDEDTIGIEIAKQIFDRVNELIVNNAVINRKSAQSDLAALLGEMLNPQNYPSKGREFKKSMQELISKIQYSWSSAQYVNILKERISYSSNIYEYISLTLNKLLDNKDFDALEYIYVSVDGVYLIAGCFVFEAIGSNLYTLTFFPEKDSCRTHFVFSSFIKSTSNTFLQKINIMESSEFKYYVSELIINKGSNVYFSPLYWDKLDTLMKNRILERKDSLANQDVGSNLFDSKFKSF